MILELEIAKSLGVFGGGSSCWFNEDDVAH